MTNVGWMECKIIVRVKWEQSFIWVGRNVEVEVKVYQRKHLISCICGQSVACASVFVMPQTLNYLLRLN